jgi:hypothetical protein
MNVDPKLTPEQTAIDSKFVECVRTHPGITAEEIAEELQVPIRFVLQACAYLLGVGMLTVDFSDGRYFSVEAPKLPDLTPPTEAGLDGWKVFYDLIKKPYNLTLEQFAALPVEAQSTIQDAVQSTEITLWRDSLHSQGYAITQESFATLGAWLDQRNAPITQRNLTEAFKAERKYLDKMKQDHGNNKWEN